MAGWRATRFQQRKLDAAFARADREAALRKQGGKCAYCLSRLTLKTATRDHIIPRSAGGLDHRNNIVAACEPCNKLKGSTPLALFLRMISRPRPGEPMKYRLVWFSRQIEKRLDVMEKRVMRSVGRR
ncbi:HNH endonuclease signature motif containing protein [Brucella sp. TWI432]